MQTIFTILIALFVFAFGTVIFSFVNVLIYRIQKGESFVKGRSHCVSCGHTLSGFDLVPLFSFVFLRGKCRYCGGKLSARYFFVELLGGLLALLCAYVFRKTDIFPFFFSIEGVVAFTAFSILTAIAFIDYDTMEIPNGLIIALIVPAIAAFFIFKDNIGFFDSLLNHGIGFFCISLPMLLLTLLINGAFGGGDIKLMAVAGFMLGWKLAIIAMFFGLLIGGVQGIFYMIKNQKGFKEHFAFAPALCIGIALSMLFGEIILNWYLTFFV
ncbi:MAG: prepilin peptidase [Clostridia bacterium]